MRNGISSVEIRNILKSCSAIVIICTKDELKKLNPIHNGLIVINTDNRNEPGNHWVCVHMQGRGMYIL